MKFVVEREALARGLARVQGVVHRKPVLPILSNILLEANTAGYLRIAATDLDVTFDSRIDARVEEPGRITVDGRRFLEIARNLPAEEAHVELSPGERVVVRAKNSEFSFNAIAAEGFPTLPGVEGLERVAVNAAALKELIERTMISISLDESRPSLNGVLFQCMGQGRIRLVSTDGHRLSQGERDLRVNGADIPARDGVIIPRKGVFELKRLLDDAPGEPTSFGFLENNFVLEAGGVKLFVRLVDATFPDVGQVIPKASEHIVVLDRLSFMAALKRCGILASERTHGVRVEFNDDQMRLISDNPDLGKAREDIEISGYEGSGGTIAFNGRYIVEILGTLTAASVEMGINEALSPGVFREHGSGDYIFVVMPMRL